MFSKTRFATGLTACLFLALVGQIHAIQSPLAKPKAAVTPRLLRKIPFALFRGVLLFVEARINNSAPLWLMVDTASSYSL